MPASPSAHRSGRQEQLLDLLIEVYLAEGFASFSVEDLAVRLRCSKSTLYAVAPSKEQLISAVVREFFRRATERVEAAVEIEDEPVDRIHAYLEEIAAQLAPASATFYADLDAFAPTREIYAANTAIAARRVRDLVAASAPQDRSTKATFIGAVAAEAMASIQQGRLRAMTDMDDAASYRALAELITAGIVGPDKAGAKAAERP